MLGDGFRSACRVVRDVADARRPRRGVQAFDGMRDRVIARVDDPVEIGEDDVDSVERCRAQLIRPGRSSPSQFRDWRRRRRRPLVHPSISTSSMTSMMSTPPGFSACSSASDARSDRSNHSSASAVATQFLEHGRVGVEERRAVRECGRRIELRDLELGECGIRLAEIEPCTGHRDRELDPNLGRQRRSRQPNVPPRAPSPVDRDRARCRPSWEAGRCDPVIRR